MLRGLSGVVLLAVGCGSPGQPRPSTDAQGEVVPEACKRACAKAECERTSQLGASVAAGAPPNGVCGVRMQAGNDELERAPPQTRVRSPLLGQGLDDSDDGEGYGYELDTGAPAWLCFSVDGGRIASSYVSFDNIDSDLDVRELERGQWYEETATRRSRLRHGCPAGGCEPRTESQDFRYRIVGDELEVEIDGHRVAGNCRWD